MNARHLVPDAGFQLNLWLQHNGRNQYLGSEVEIVAAYKNKYNLTYFTNFLNLS